MRLPVLTVLCSLGKTSPHPKFSNNDLEQRIAETRLRLDRGKIYAVIFLFSFTITYICIYWGVESVYLGFFFMSTILDDFDMLSVERGFECNGRRGEMNQQCMSHFFVRLDGQDEF